MSARNISRKDRAQQLRAAYQEAFDGWAFAITRLQVVSRSMAAGDAIAEAQQRVADAYAAYRETRDLFASNLVNLRTANTAQAKLVPFRTAKSAAHR